MSTRKIKNSWWVDLRVSRKRYRLKCPENSKAGASAYERILRGRLARGEPIQGKVEPKQKFGDFAEQWFATYVEANNKFSERRSKRSILNKHLIPFFGSFDLKEITSGQVERFKNEKMATGLHPKSINNQLAVLQKSLRCAVEWDHLTASPVIKHLRVPPLDIDFLNEDECKVLLAYKINTTAQAMILTAMHTGIRLGEIMALEWTAVDFEKRQIKICRSVVRNMVSSPKSNRIRHLPMTNQLVTLLKSQKKIEGLVFTRDDGSMLSDALAAKWLTRACKAAGIRRVGWHLLRHTFASRLVSKGIPLRTVQELLGHSTIAMTERYAHLAPRTLVDAVRVLENDDSNQLWAPGGQREMENMLKRLFVQSSETHEIART